MPELEQVGGRLITAGDFYGLPRSMRLALVRAFPSGVIGMYVGQVEDALRDNANAALARRFVQFQTARAAHAEQLVMDTSFMVPTPYDPPADAAA